MAISDGLDQLKSDFKYVEEMVFNLKTTIEDPDVEVNEFLDDLYAVSEAVDDYIYLVEAWELN